MNPRKGIFWFHLICGIIVGAVVLIMSVTGTILAFEHQIVEYAEHNVRKVAIPAQAIRLTLDEIVAKASEVKPESKVSSVMVKSEPNASVLVSFGREDAFYFDPYTGKKLGGDSAAHKFMHDVEVWHRWLGMEGDDSRGC